MTVERIAWHPGFASAVQLELGAYRGQLVYETEHELNKQSLRIDLLVIKKNRALVIEDDIAQLFRGHNILEFKFEQDGLTIDDLFKTLAYGCLYKAYGPEVDAIDARDVTITLVRHAQPERLFAKLDEIGCPVQLVGAGIYYVDNLLFPLQVVVTGELEPARHPWLASLASDLETSQLRQLVVAASALSSKEDRELADSVLNVVTLANSDTMAHLKEEEKMAKTLYEIMQPEIDAAIAAARLEAAADAAALGMERGLEQGLEKGLQKGLEKGKQLGAIEARAETIRATIVRMLDRGGFSPEEIADLAGSTVEEVHDVAASLGKPLM